MLRWMCVGCTCHCDGSNSGCNVGNEDLGGFEEAHWEAEEDSNACGYCCDECLEVAIDVEGNEGENWSS